MRQYKTLIICLFFLSIFCLSKVNAIVKDYSLLGKVIYVDEKELYKNKIKKR